MNSRENEKRQQEWLIKSAAELQKLHDEGVFFNSQENASNVPEETFLVYVKKLRSGASPFPRNPYWPEVELGQRSISKEGANMCVECGRVYWILPSDDAYKGKSPDGKVCKNCLH